MITKFDFTNAETAVVYHLNDDVSPMSELDATVTQRLDRSRTKMQQHGVWPTFNFRGELELHVEGKLLANDATDYVTKRFALTAALFGNAGPDSPTVRKAGDLAITFDGLGEDIGGPVSIDAFSAPIIGGYPGSSDYLITFVSFDPWLVGLTSGNKFYIS